jgi:hypothetical protein
MPPVIGQFEHLAFMTHGFEIVYEIDQYGTRRIDAGDKIMYVPYGNITAVRQQWRPVVSNIPEPYGRLTLHMAVTGTLQLTRDKDYVTGRTSGADLNGGAALEFDPLNGFPMPELMLEWNRLNDSPPHSSMVLENSTTLYLNNTNNSHSNTLGAWTPASGRLLLAGISIDQNETPTMDTAGFTAILNAAYHGGIDVSWKEGASETSVDWSWTTANDSQSWVGEYSGWDTADGIDISASGTAGTNVASLTVGPTATTSDANELVWAFAGHSSHDGVAIGSNFTGGSPNPALTTISTLNASSGGECSGQVGATDLTATQALTVIKTNGVSDQTALAVGSFKESVGGGGLSITVAMHQYARLRND